MKQAHLVLVDTVQIAFVYSTKATLTKKAIGSEVPCGHREVPESEGLRSDLVVVRSIAQDDVLVHLQRVLLRHTGRRAQFGFLCSSSSSRKSGSSDKCLSKSKGMAGCNK